jgi:hypothetical protein
MIDAAVTDDTRALTFSHPTPIICSFATVAMLEGKFKERRIAQWDDTVGYEWALWQSLETWTLTFTREGITCIVSSGTLTRD